MWKKLLFFLIILGIFFMVLIGCINLVKKIIIESLVFIKILKDLYFDEQFLLGIYVCICVYDEGKEVVLKFVFD